MTRYNGGTKVGGGYYFNLRTWDFQAVEGAAGPLPGADSYLHLPALVVLPAALVLSFVFVVFLPAIGLGLAAYALAAKFATLSHGSARSLAATVAPSYRPGLAFFAGEAKQEEAAPVAAPSDQLTSLEQDIAARREAEEKQ